MKIIINIFFEHLILKNQHTEKWKTYTDIDKPLILLLNVNLSFLFVKIMMF